MKQENRRKGILAVLVFSAFIALFNETILNVALNSLMKEMNVTAATVQWLITAYMIVVSVMVPVTAFLIQTFEIRRLYQSAMLLLLIGTIVAACSVSFPMLLGARMLQALGTGMMIPIMMNTVLIVTPIAKRGMAMGICVCAIQLGPALGPTVSGVILQFAPWKYLFIFLIPLVILGMIWGAICLENVTTITKPKLDMLSVALSTMGVGGIIYGLSSFGESTNLVVTGCIFGVGLLLMVLFVRRQFKLEQPMLEIGIFRYSKFSMGTILVMISMMTIFTLNILLPMFLQVSLETTTFISAIALLPATLANGAMTLVGGKIFDRMGAMLMIPIGYIVMLVGVVVLSGANAGTPIIAIVLIYIMVCVGVGATMSPAQTNSLHSLPKESYPHGVAIINTLQQIAAAMGSSLFISVMSTGGFQKALWLMGIFIVAGFLISLALRKVSKGK